MNKLIVLLALVLAGCSSSPSPNMGNMLDVAPRGPEELLYPEWGEPEVTTYPVTQRSAQVSRVVEGPYGVKKSDAIDSFSYYLSRLGIDHVILPGNHIVVKLNKKVQFATGSDVVSRDSARWLKQLGGYISNMSEIDIIIEGHADSRGSNKINEKLSEQRAMMVKQELMEQNISPASIFTRGYGDYMPICSNKTKSGMACNRRVELSFVLASR